VCWGKFLLVVVAIAEWSGVGGVWVCDTLGDPLVQVGVGGGLVWVWVCVGYSGIPMKTSICI